MARGLLPSPRDGFSGRILLESKMTKATKRRVPILVKAETAKEVRVTGDFNDWVKEGIPLSHDGGGTWLTRWCAMTPRAHASNGSSPVMQRKSTTPSP